MKHAESGSKCQSFIAEPLKETERSCGTLYWKVSRCPRTTSSFDAFAYGSSCSIIGLVLSGPTAFPLERETGLLKRIFHVAPALPASGEPALHTWLRTVHNATVRTNRDYPFMAYGTDWLAFAHLAIAVAFLGPLRDPVRNKWVLVFGVIACAGVIPLALIAGPIRGIPFYWRLIDCSFGVLGVIPLLICICYVGQIERSS